LPYVACNWTNGSTNSFLTKCSFSSCQSSLIN
jgi:hypothetical protein